MQNLPAIFAFITANGCYLWFLGHVYNPVCLKLAPQFF